MASTGHALTAFLPTDQSYDSCKYTSPNPKTPFRAACLLLWEVVRDLSIRWQQSPVVTGCMCRPLHQFPHFLSVVLNIYQVSQQYFSLSTNSKWQQSTQDRSQDMSISRRVFDITGPGASNVFGILLPEEETTTWMSPHDWKGFS